MAIKTLEEKFQHELGDIYDAEHQFLDAQREMLPQATNEQVKKLLEQHIKQTEQQITVLEQAFAALGQAATRIKCQGAAGIVTENKKTLKEVSSNPALINLAIAGGSAKVEHYEVVSYRALVAGAEAMNQTKVMKLLQRNLVQEEATATKVEASLPKLLQQAVSQAAPSSGAGASSGATKKGAAKAATKSATKSASTKSASKAAAAGVTNGATTIKPPTDQPSAHDGEQQQSSTTEQASAGEGE